MQGLNLELRCDIDIKARERGESLLARNGDLNKNEAYYNVGADEILEIVACYCLSQLEREEECLKLREAIINDEFEENVKDYSKASQSANLLIQEFFKLGFKSGFKLAKEADKNTLSMPVSAIHNEFTDVETILSNIDWNDIHDGEES